MRVNAWAVSLLFTLVCVVAFLSSAPREASPDSTTKLEITQIDLFGLRHWSSTQVTIYGFRLGMTIREASALARRKRFSLNEEATQGPCLELPKNPNFDVDWRACHVMTARALPTGVELHFRDRDSVVDRIEVYVLPAWGSPASWRRDALTKRLIGRTYRLMNHYSDELRLSFLGPEDSSEERRESSYLVRKSYLYRKLGLVFKVSYDRVEVGKAPMVELDSIELIGPR